MLRRERPAPGSRPCADAEAGAKKLPEPGVRPIRPAQTGIFRFRSGRARSSALRATLVDRFTEGGSGHIGLAKRRAKRLGRHDRPNEARTRPDPAAAVRPEGWKEVLHYLAEVTGCVAGGITVEDAHTRTGEPLVYFGFDPDHVRRTFDYYLPINPLFGIAERMKPGFVVTNGDVIDERAFRRTEFFNGWARPQDLCCPTTVVLSRKSGKYCPLTLVRPVGKGTRPGPICDG